MEKEQQIAMIRDTGLISIMRAKTSEDLIEAAKAVKAVLAPLPQVALIPTGGVNLETIGPFLKAGAVAVAAGSSLVSQEILNEKNFLLLTERAKSMRQEVVKVRHDAHFKN